MCETMGSGDAEAVPEGHHVARAVPGARIAARAFGDAPHARAQPHPARGAIQGAGLLAEDALPWWVRRELEQQLWRRADALKEALRAGDPPARERSLRRVLRAREVLESARGL